VSRVRLGPGGALLVLLLLLAGGCGRGPAAERPAIAFWTSFPRAAVEPLLARFTAANAGIRVELRELPAGAMADSAAAALAAGHPPDLCQLPGEGLGEWLAGGELSDWSAGVADLRGELRGWEQCMVGDAIYGLPWTLSAPVLVYDRALFAQAGLDSTRAPATWAEVRTAAGRIQRLPGGVGGIGLASGSAAEWARSWLPWAFVNDGGVLSSEADSSRMSRPENEEALAFLSSLRPVALIAPRDSLERAFLSGRVGMLLAEATLAEAAERAGRRPGAGLVPRPSAASPLSASPASGAVLVSFTHSRRKEDALRLARFLVEPASTGALVAAVPEALPARVDADSVGAFAGRPFAAVALRQLVTARYTPRLRSWTALEARLGEAVAEAVTGRASPARALAAADSFVASHPGAR
jgi:ABC-type glycerol-3-phosphate transport system substrate-binding protein